MACPAQDTIQWKFRIYTETYGTIQSSLTTILSKKSKLGTIFLRYVIAHTEHKPELFIMKAYRIFTEQVESRRK